MNLQFENKRKKVFQNQGEQYPSFFDNAVLWCRADDYTLNASGYIDQLNDRTGNGYHLINTGNADISLDTGINDNAKCVFDTSNGLGITSSFPQIADLTKRAIVIVYQITNPDNTVSPNYQLPVIHAVTNFTNAGSNFMMIYHTNNNNQLIANYPNNSLDDTANVVITDPRWVIQCVNGSQATIEGSDFAIQTKTGNQNVNASNLYIGRWRTNAYSFIDFYEVLLFDNDITEISGSNLTQLKNYLNNRYNL